MFLKAQLHFHNGEDPLDSYINYSPYEAIDFAKQKGFRILSFTNHNYFCYNKKVIKYAFERGIILINGIELSIRNKHVLIYNPTPEVLNIKTFKDLEKYKLQNRRIFVIAPHPYYKAYFCLGKKMEKYHYLFDAIEYSIMHMQKFFTKANDMAQNFARRYNKAFIGTGDVHDLNFFDDTYSLINVDFDTENLDFSKFDFYIKNIFKNIRLNNFKIVSKPLSLKNIVNFNRGHIKGFFIKNLFR